MRVKLKGLREFIRDSFVGQMESVNRSRRGEEDDYEEENEGPGTTYEDVDRVRRAKDGAGETEFDESCENYSNTYSDPMGDKKKKKGLSHAVPAGELDGLGESFSLPSMKNIFMGKGKR